MEKVTVKELFEQFGLHPPEDMAPRSSRERKRKYNARTSAERCNKREKVDYKLEDGRYRSSRMWYCRLADRLMILRIYFL